ncbi:MAG: ATP-binding protein [Desulfopila sp.]|jgi:two-component system sensor histidine kinase HydH|nr:ATP-binding protein [Desulfopila sp.]
MKETPSRPPAIPMSSPHLYFSRGAAGLLIATFILAIILVFSTLQNINRAQSLMEQFLQDKGEAIIRSIEAGSRAGITEHMEGINPMHNLLVEHAKDKDIRFITITAADGKILEHIGENMQTSLSAGERTEIGRSHGSVGRMNRDTAVFVLSRIFQDSGSAAITDTATQQLPQPPSPEAEQKIISIGLPTSHFDTARRQDVRHTIFMGAILFLVGTAGLYFLFLYQKIRLTSSNLADMKLYTENILESIPVAIITLDAHDNIVSCNHNTEELFGLNLNLLQKTGLGNILQDCSFSISATCDNLFEKEVVCKGHNGVTIPLRVSCSPLVNRDNEKIGKVLILRDMSSIKEMELQLERTRRMAALGKMAAGIAHEIRNPLGTLRGFAQFFGNQAEAGSDAKDYSQLMISEIDRLNQTISGLLQFSRPRSPQITDVSAGALFAKTVSLLEADLSGKSIELHWQKEENVRLQADPDLLLQVLMNLLKNSIRATPPGGSIVLECTKEAQSVVITVADNGSGMTEEVRERMFDPFFTTTGSGTGLGLAVSHQIIEQHGGTFEVRTELDKGTTIRIHLPQKRGQQ